MSDKQTKIKKSSFRPIFALLNLLVKVVEKSTHSIAHNMVDPSYFDSSRGVGRREDENSERRKPGEWGAEPGENFSVIVLTHSNFDC